MRRAHTLLLMFALLATPLLMAVGARASVEVSCPVCGTMRHLTGAACLCPMHQKAQLPNASFAAPLAPVLLSATARLTPPKAERTRTVDRTIPVSQGFIARPFSPPRS